VRTFRNPLTIPTPLAELASLILDIGEPCFASGPTAAALHEFDGFRLVRPFHLLVPRGRYVSRLGAVVHTSTEIPLIDVERIHGIIPVLSPTRTLIDIAGSETAARLTAAVDGAVRDGKTSEDFLIRRIVALRTKGRYGLPKLIRVIEGSEATKGGHSWLEREYLRLTATAGLPKPTTQKVLSRSRNRLVRVDCHYPDTRVVVELLGYRWHRTKEQIRRDTDRLNALLLDGYLPLQFTTMHLVEEPGLVIADVASALRSVSAHRRTAAL
jgi:very-short-patch-repair endonuclease